MHRLAALFLLAAACGRREEDPSTLADPEIAALLPGDAFAAGRIASRDELDAFAARLSRFPLVRLSGLVERLLPSEAGGLAADRNRPVGFAFAEAGRVLALPTAGGYRAVGAGGAPGPSTLFAALPPGLVSARVDLVRARARFGGELRAFVEAVPQVADRLLPRDAARSLGAALREALDSGETLEAALDYERAVASLEVRLRAREGSALRAAAAPPSRLDELARFAPAGTVAAALVSDDARDAADWLLRLLDLAVADDFWGGWGDEAALFAALGGSAPRVVFVLRAEDAPAKAAALAEALEGAEPPRRAGGFHVTRARVPRMRLPALGGALRFPERGAVCDCAAGEGILLLCFDDRGTLLDELLGGSGGGADLRRRLRALGASPRALLRVDPRALARAAGLERVAATNRDGSRGWCDAYLAAEPWGVRLGVLLDVDALEGVLAGR